MTQSGIKLFSFQGAPVMTRKEREKELDRLVASCRSFQRTMSEEDDGLIPEAMDEIWDLTEDIIREREKLRGGKW